METVRAESAEDLSHFFTSGEVVTIPKDIKAMSSIFKLLWGGGKEYCNFRKKILALVAIQPQVEITFFEQFSAVSTEKVWKKDSPYGQFQKAVRKAK